MIKLLFLIFLCAISSLSFGALSTVSPFSTGTVPPPGATAYCLPATPTKTAGYFIAPVIVTATASPSTNLEQYDGTYYYVTTITTVAGSISPTVSCPLAYSTKQ